MQPISQKICKYNVFRPKICKYVVFSPEIRKYGIFVAKICKNALIDSFEGFAVVIDNSASYAGLVGQADKAIRKNWDNTRFTCQGNRK